MELFKIRRTMVAAMSIAIVSTMSVSVFANENETVCEEAAYCEETFCDENGALAEEVQEEELSIVGEGEGTGADLSNAIEIGTSTQVTPTMGNNDTYYVFTAPKAGAVSFRMVPNANYNNTVVNYYLYDTDKQALIKEQRVYDNNGETASIYCDKDDKVYFRISGANSYGYTCHAVFSSDNWAKKTNKNIGSAETVELGETKRGFIFCKVNNDYGNNVSDYFKVTIPKKGKYRLDYEGDCSYAIKNEGGNEVWSGYQLMLQPVREYDPGTYYIEVSGGFSTFSKYSVAFCAAETVNNQNNCEVESVNTRANIIKNKSTTTVDLLQVDTDTIPVTETYNRGKLKKRIIDTSKNTISENVITVNAGTKFTVNGKKGSFKIIKDSNGEVVRKSSFATINKTGKLKTKTVKNKADYYVLIEYTDANEVVRKLRVNIENVKLGKSVETLKVDSKEGCTVDIDKLTTADNSNLQSANWTISAGKGAKTVARYIISADNKSVIIRPVNGKRGKVKVTAAINGKKYSIIIKIVQ